MKLGQRRPQVDGGCCFAYAALLIGYGNDFCLPVAERHAFFSG